MSIAQAVFIIEHGLTDKQAYTKSETQLIILSTARLSPANVIKPAFHDTDIDTDIFARILARM